MRDANAAHSRERPCPIAVVDSILVAVVTDQHVHPPVPVRVNDDEPPRVVAAGGEAVGRDFAD